MMAEMLRGYLPFDVHRDTQIFYFLSLLFRLCAQCNENSGLSSDQLLMNLNLNLDLQILICKLFNST